MSFTEIKAAIAELTPQQRTELIALLTQSPPTDPASGNDDDDVGDDDWDRQIEADAAAGRLDSLIADAWREWEAGHTRPLP